MASRFELKKSKNDKFVFNLLADNGKVILTSELTTPRPARSMALNPSRKTLPTMAAMGG
jgi:uncharacterized protein YegP (UPF0339 family)